MSASNAYDKLNDLKENSSFNEEPLRLVANEAEPLEDGDIEIAPDHSWPLLPVGIYRAKFIKQEIVSLRMFKGAARLFVHFEILDAKGGHSVRIYGAWPVSATSQGGKTRISVAARSNLSIMLCKIFGYRMRLDRVSFQSLKGCVVKVKTRTVKKNFRQRALPECMHYSVVDDIIEIETGAI